MFRRRDRQLDGSGSLSYYQAFAPSDTPLAILVGVAAQRWRIEECFQLAKDQLGLGDYEVRSWGGWHRHTALVLATQAFLSVLRSQVEPLGAPSPPPFFSTPVGAGSLDAFRAARGLWFD